MSRTAKPFNIFNGNGPRWILLAVNIALWLVLTRSQRSNSPMELHSPPKRSLQERTSTSTDPCKPYFPGKLLQVEPTNAEDQTLKGALQKVDQLISNAVSSHASVDSVTIGIVSAKGTIWSKGYGRRNANSTDTTPPDEDTIYRIGSGSKLFAVLEGFILRDQGLINWDDPVSKYIPGFAYSHQTWQQLRNNQTATEEDFAEPMTLRQLSTHMAGIDRDLPDFNWDAWPSSPPISPALTPKTLEQIVAAIAETPLVSPLETTPTYSNSGYSVLGMSLLAVANKAAGTNMTYPELLQRDIFTPLGMTGSSFAATPENAARIAYPKNPAEIYWNPSDNLNPVGGQFSSVADLSKAVQSLLNPSKLKSILSPATKREWMRPVHVFPDHQTESGMGWEIFKFDDSHGREQRYYTKSGDLAFSHSIMLVNPELQYGIVVLNTGASVARTLGLEVTKILQPAFEKVLENRVAERYAGSWKGENGDQVDIQVSDGVLSITKWTTAGVDFFSKYKAAWADRISMWSTGRLDEFRISFGYISQPSGNMEGCFVYWATRAPILSHHAPVDLLYWEEQGDQRVLVVPSSNVKLTRA
ncbi:hypothetical protein PIIN_03363 [Serendipita indica DSM 11827]|uniref:Beta-lactamase-related domain-containing protein n=1 Tax=Serendipita indica (strain DSM 11827) TaxID=1109443 RepID=G4TDQ1_SERID|nr:hypothetical protein PIIN_03363 [Serendipita indica DSM 11827]